MAIQIETLAKGLLGYKSGRYAEFCPYTNMTTAKDSEDWSGLYIAPKKELAEGYCSDYLDDSGNGTVNVHEVYLLSNIKVAVCDDKSMGDGSTPGDKKASALREQLKKVGINLGSGPLIPELGRLGYFYKGYHDPDDMEIIVPNKLSAFVCMMKPVTLAYKNWMRLS